MSYKTIQSAAIAADQASRRTGEERFVVYEPGEDRTFCYQICDEYDLDTYYLGLSPLYSTLDNME